MVRLHVRSQTSFSGILFSCSPEVPDSIGVKSGRVSAHSHKCLRTKNLGSEWVSGDSFTLVTLRDSPPQRFLTPGVGDGEVVRGQLLLPPCYPRRVLPQLVYPHQRLMIRVHAEVSPP
ncbi:hypothetical protein AAG570_013093 [Ranatra chinensis]|uniref:Uncharacterized protein n=1 Tax=Ranatra chinensis TaxID=642074 RepID=A0ABD0YFT2_9HEMI